MPSLRRSLILYFVLLLAVGLGTVALLADQVIGSALADKEIVTAKLIDRTIEDRLDEEEKRFEIDLLGHARVVARTAGIEYAAQMDVANKRFTVLQETPTVGLFAPGLIAPSWPIIAAWKQSLTPPPRRGPGPPQQTPTFSTLLQDNYRDLKFEEYLVKHLDEDENSPNFVQVNYSRNTASIWRSPNLGTTSMPFDRNRWESEGERYRFDDVMLPGGRARRISFKTTAFGVPGMMQWGPRSTISPNPQLPATRDVGAQPQRPGDAMSWFPRSYIHVARLTAPRDSAMREIRETAEAEKAQLAEGTATTRKTIRITIAISCGVAFLGMVIGGWILIGHGLSPLKNLSDAVSRVSEKDFRLPIHPDDLTEELVPIHDRLTQSLEALKQAFEREKEAVADISHELRTPVAGLLATIDVALRKPRTAEQYKQTLEDCRGITKQLGGLVERVMTLAYLDAGQAGVNDAPTDAADIAADCASVIRPLAEAHGLAFQMDVEEPTEMMTDADKLREVLINLLHNAVEYTNPGGKVRLSVRREPNTERVVVEVTDTGIGMTTDVRGKIFDRFYRADPSRTATGVHAGLGLAIVKEYVDRLGGTISVESEPGRGSTFRVNLPG